MKVHKRCACGAEVTVEMPSASSTNNSSHRETIWKEREDLKKQIASWDKEHKGHTGLTGPTVVQNHYPTPVVSPLTVGTGTARPLPQRPENTC